jgi:hypothetical protein
MDYTLCRPPHAPYIKNPLGCELTGLTTNLNGQNCGDPPTHETCTTGQEPTRTRVTVTLAAIMIMDESGLHRRHCPLGSVPLAATQNKAGSNWRTCLAWSIARGTASKMLFMDKDTLSAMLWDYVNMGAIQANIKSIVDSVLFRHRAAQLQPPL